MANLGQSMANAVDAEIATYRKIQEEIQKLRTDQQLLMQQRSENEMVKQELDIIDASDSSSHVYKLVGPALMKNDLGDAKQTVEQRLELIIGELKKVEKTAKDKEEKSIELAKKIQQMNGAMQAAAVEAAKAAAQQASA